MDMLVLEAVSKSYGGVQALCNVTASIRGGEVTSLVGPNGAGKTTLLNVVTGSTKADSGRVQLRGREVLGLSAWRVARLGVARTFQELRLCPDLSVLEHVLVALRRTSDGVLAALVYSRRSRKARQLAAKARALLDQCEMLGNEQRRVGDLSYGQQKLLALATALASSPRILLLDEPIAGLQPRAVEVVEDILRAYVADTSCAVVLIEHDIEFVARLANRVIVMDQGRVVADDAPGSTAIDEAVLHTYL